MDSSATVTWRRTSRSNATAAGSTTPTLRSHASSAGRAAVAVLVDHPAPDLVHPLAVRQATGHARRAEVVGEPGLEDHPRREPAGGLDRVELVVVPVADHAVQVEHDGLDRWGSGEIEAPSYHRSPVTL